MDKVYCPMCGSNDSQFLRSIRNRDPMMEMRFPTISISICGVCGLIHQNPRISQAAMRDLYRLLEDKPAGTNATHYEGESRLKALMGLRPPPATLLEVGCSDGTFSGLASRAGFQVSGIDPSAANLVHARRAYPDIEFFEGFIETFESDRRFDVICHFYALEYSFDPLRFLTAARKLLNPDGLMLLEVPDAGTFSKLPFANSLFTHQDVTIFTAATLESMLMRAGFCILPTQSELASKRYGIRLAATLGPVISTKLSDYDAGLLAINHYFERRNEMLERIKHRIEELLVEIKELSGPVVIFGAGENGRIVIDTSLAGSGRKMYFCDNNPETIGLKIDGYEVVSPDRVPELRPALVIAASIDYQEDMVQQMRTLGVPHTRIVKLYNFATEGNK